MNELLEAIDVVCLSCWHTFEECDGCPVAEMAGIELERLEKEEGARHELVRSTEVPRLRGNA